jgi:hypothetical protein
MFLVLLVSAIPRLKKKRGIARGRNKRREDKLPHIDAC